MRCYRGCVHGPTCVSRASAARALSHDAECDYCARGHRRATFTVLVAQFWLLPFGCNCKYVYSPCVLQFRYLRFVITFLLSEKPLPVLAQVCFLSQLRTNAGGVFVLRMLGTSENRDDCVIYFCTPFTSSYAHLQAVSFAFCFVAAIYKCSLCYGVSGMSSQKGCLLLDASRDA